MAMTLPKKLTTCQRRVLEFIQNCVRENGCPPTRQEIANHFKYRSLTTVESHLRLIVRKGFLKIEPNLSRGLQLVNASQATRSTLLDVPLYGSIPAGPPDEREAEVIRYLTVDPETVKAKLSSDAFALQVRGDSMVERHILDGDHVIIEPRREARHQDVVAALIDGQTTLKTLVVKGGKSYLKAENPKYKDLIPKEDLRVNGVAVAVLRSLRK
jgi:repressor LexA